MEALTPTMGEHRGRGEEGDPPPSPRIPKEEKEERKIKRKKKESLKKLQFKKELKCHDIFYSIYIIFMHKNLFKNSH